MQKLFPLFLLLPLLELAGFVIIGGRIGLGLTLVWLIGAGCLGSMVIKSAGTQSWKRLQSGENVTLAPDLFDALARLAAGLLLILPGFFSDLLAAIILIEPLRKMLYRRIQPIPAATRPQDSTVIEGDYRRIDGE